MRRKNKTSGFTLVEIMIVIVGIVLLGVLAASGYKNIIPKMRVDTAETLVGKLNNAANEWMTFKIQSGEINTKLNDLGDDLESAIVSLQTPIEIFGQEVSTGIPKSTKVAKVSNLGIVYENGEFSLPTNNDA